MIEDASKGIQDFHVTPVDDLKPHVIGRKCWCNPKEDSEYLIFTHNSLDNREKYEANYSMIN